MSMRIGNIQKLIKVDVKIVTILIHGILEVRNSIRIYKPKKIQTEVAELINPESQTPQSKIKKLVLTVF
jgi:hypothetical protein